MVIASSNFFIGQGLLFSDSFKESLKSLGTRFALITDTVVAPLYGEKLLKQLLKWGFETQLFTFPSGELSKTRRQKELLEDTLFEHGFMRDTAIIALGGGVVTDLVGFIAATFCRGVPLISIPTTLLAMVDASIGAKVGVNVPYGKNLVGAFYSPHSIWSDIEVLSTLDAGEWQNGLVEMIKHGLIADAGYLVNLAQANLQDPQSLIHLIRTSQSLKLKIVSQDPHELNIRRVLNFGHTLGHAIETVSDYQISHGRAVAIGMVMESLLGEKMGLVRRCLANDIKELLQSFRINLECSYPTDQLIKALIYDKKSSQKNPRFVVLEDIAHPAPFKGDFCCPIDTHLLKETLDEYDIAHSPC